MSSKWGTLFLVGLVWRFQPKQESYFVNNVMSLTNQANGRKLNLLTYTHSSIQTIKTLSHGHSHSLSQGHSNNQNCNKSHSHNHGNGYGPQPVNSTPMHSRLVHLDKFTLNRVRDRFSLSVAMSIHGLVCCITHNCHLRPNGESFSHLSANQLFTIFTCPEQL